MFFKRVGRAFVAILGPDATLLISYVGAVVLLVAFLVGFFLGCWTGASAVAHLFVNHISIPELS